MTPLASAHSLPLLTPMERRQLEKARAEIAAVGVQECSPATRQTIAHLVAIGCCSLETMSQLVGIPAETLRPWCGQDRKREEQKAKEREMEEKKADDRSMKALPTKAQSTPGTVKAVLSPRPITWAVETRLAAARAEIALKGEQGLSRSTQTMLIRLVESGRDSHTISQLAGVMPETLQRWVEESRQRNKKATSRISFPLLPTSEVEAKLQAISAEIAAVGTPRCSVQSRETLVQWVESGQSSIVKISQQVGIPEGTLARWVKQYRKTGKVTTWPGSPEDEAKLNAAREEIANVGGRGCSVQTRETLVKWVKTESDVNRISQLVGVPWSTLRYWVTQYRQTGKITKPRRLRPLSAEEEAKLQAAKAEIVAGGAQACSLETRHCLIQLVESGHPIKHISQGAGVSEATLSRWVDHYRKTGMIIGHPARLPTTDEEAQLERVKAEIDEVGGPGCSLQTRALLVQLVESGIPILPLAQRIGMQRVTLQAWVNNYRKTGKISRPQTKRSQRRTFEAAAKRLQQQIVESCPIELRRDAVALLDAGCDGKQLAQWLGVDELTLRRWAKDCREDHGGGQDGQSR